MNSSETDTALDAIIAALNDDVAYDYFFRNLPKKKDAVALLPLLKEKGLLDLKFLLSGRLVKSEESETIHADFWPALPFLEYCALENSRNPSQDTTEFLKDFVLDLGEKQRTFKSEKRNVRNYRADYFVLRIIGHLPATVLNKDIIRLIFECSENDYGGQSALLAEHITPRILETDNSNLISVFIENLLKPKSQQKGFSLSKKSPPDFHCILGDYYLSHFYGKYAKDIVAKYPSELQRIIVKHMRAILKKNEFYFRHWHIVSIDNNVEMRSPNQGDYNYILSDLLRDASTTLSLKNAQLIRSYFDEPERYFHRLALHVISKNYAHLSDIFWSQYRATNPVNDLEIKPELFTLIRDNCMKFSESQVSRVIEWIESANRPYYEKVALEDGRDKVEKIKAYDELEWFEFALKRLKSDKIAAKIKRLKKIAPWKREIPAGFSSGPIKTSFGSPTKYTHTELAALPVGEAVQKIMAFKGHKGPSWDKPTEEGQGDHIQTWANAQSTTITQHLDLFKVFKSKYKTRLLYGLRTAINEGKEVHWENLFQFLRDIINQKSFWEVIQPRDNNYSEEYALLGAMADILYEASNSKRQLPIETVSESLQPLILELLEKNPLHIETIRYHDVFSEYINHPAGKCWESAVRCCTLLLGFQHREPELQFKHDIKEYFTQRLSSSVLHIEEIIGLAMLYPVLGKNDLNLSEQILNTIFKTADDQNFNYAITGFLFASHNVWIDIYKIFRPEGIFARAIRVFDWESQISDRLVAYLIWGYFYIEDTIDGNDSMIQQFVDTAPISRIERLVWLVWSQAVDVRKRSPDLILPLWQLINKRIAKSDASGSRTASYLLNWLILYDKLDDAIAATAVQTVDCFKDSFSFNHTIEYLDDHWELNQPYVLRVLVHIYEKGFVPNYPTERIKNLLRKIIQSEHKKAGQYICRQYLDARIYDFTDVCGGQERAH
jgi:hypothetical protein